jgi:O-succinylbenzoic acid--CoA ligase
VTSALRVVRAARETPDRVALADEHGTLTFAELARAVLERADALAIEPGRRVLIVPSPTRAGVLCVLALLERGAPTVLVHPRWTATERAAAIARTDPALVLEDDRVVERRSPDGPPQPPAEPGVVVFTSGSRGRPKAVELSHDALAAAARAHAEILPWAPDDRWLLAMPLAHVGGLSILTRALLGRRAVVLGPPRFAPEGLRAAIARHRVTLLSLVPTMLARLLPGPPPPTLRAVLVGGAACPDALLARGREQGWPLLPTYGLTEGCAQLCTQRLDDPRPTGVGPPLPGVEVRVTDGEIEIRGPTLMRGFLDDPTPWQPGGWYRTGDIGRLDADGHLHVSGRADDRIVTGGENVDPCEVEATLAQHPAVEESCVVGLPDPTWGQVVGAMVSGDVDETCLIRYVADRLAPFKRPRRWAFVDGLPLLASGKVDRGAVARQLARFE